MKRIAIICLLLSLIFTSAFSQKNQTGAISPDLLKQIRSSLKLDGATRGMINAISNNDIKKLAYNRQLAGKTDHFFKYRVKTKGITNQKSSGRCWLFTSLNVLRPIVIEKHNMKEFFFSENYSFFWDQFEKANLFLEAIISTRKKDIDDREVQWLFQHPIQDGGVWNYAVDLIEKYGVVPENAMSETFHSENTGTMRRLLARKLREQGIRLRQLYQAGKSLRALRKQKVEFLKEIYRMLVINLGEPPETFTWRYEDADGNISEPKTYSPQQFYREFVGINLRDYVQLMDDPSKEYYKLYEIKYDRNMLDGANWVFINLPVEKIKKFAQKSIMNNEAMYFSCDVGKQLDREKGVLALGVYDYESIYGVKFGMNKAERILTFDSGSTHGMALIGFDESPDGKTTQWLLENSWGKSAGHNGYLTMTDRWFDEYMFRLVVNKKYVSPDVLKILQQKPIVLPPWDRMF
ncbi:MAG: C1 family peptidase [Calditrichaeota bacterium]|nr:C1 family peptidase [Calditrichota bacterium]